MIGLLKLIFTMIEDPVKSNIEAPVGPKANLEYYSKWLESVHMLPEIYSHSSL